MSLWFHRKTAIFNKEPYNRRNVLSAGLGLVGDKKEVP